MSWGVWPVQGAGPIILSCSRGSPVEDPKCAPAQPTGDRPALIQGQGAADSGGPSVRAGPGLDTLSPSTREALSPFVLMPYYLPTALQLAQRLSQLLMPITDGPSLLLEACQASCWGAEAGELKVPRLSRAEGEFKASLRNLAELCLKT